MQPQFAFCRILDGGLRCSWNVLEPLSQFSTVFSFHIFCLQPLVFLLPHVAGIASPITPAFFCFCLDREVLQDLSLAIHNHLWRCLLVHTQHGCSYTRLHLTPWCYVPDCFWGIFTQPVPWVRSAEVVQPYPATGASPYHPLLLSTHYCRRDYYHILGGSVSQPGAN